MSNNEKELFDEMVMAGFKGIKVIMEVEDLQDNLTPDDARKIAQGIERLMVNWIEFMRLATHGK